MPNNRRPSPISGPNQSGVILVTVLIVVAVVSVLATQMFYDKNINHRRTANIVDADRAYEYVLGAEDLAIGLLDEAFRQEDSKGVNLGQAWAKGPLVFPIEGGNLTGEVRDLGSCFNLNSVLAEATAPGGQSNGEQVDTALEDRGPGGPEADQPRDPFTPLGGQKIFARLLESLLVELEDLQTTPEALAAALRDWADEDIDPAGPDGAEDLYYLGLERPYRTGNTLLADESELLTIKGFTPEIYSKIRDYVCVLPETAGQININTVAPEQAELVWMLMESATLDTVRQVLSSRPEQGFATTADFFARIGEGQLSNEGSGWLVIDSPWFQLDSNAIVGRGRAQLKTLLKKNSKHEFQVVARHTGDI